MQVKLTQDYYGFISQLVLPTRQTAADQTQPQPQPQRQTVLPAERLVEGELLRNRKAGGNTLDELLQRGRFSGDSANSQRGGSGTSNVRRAINSYLDNAAAPRAGNPGRPQAVDYYA